ncbi:TPA: response regulator transcription factor [Legionella pneumophila]|uniref:response regulator transcription factor n=1 Tax=Legionella pneumophila TaxID=446 RepID=UPI0010AA9C4B|nr:response regulator [Legionella pneumophila]TIG84075.1 DNA-binding response regulator [Legionella pneumophila]HAT1864793.1 response regulator transcription factor [Legionella pneumophila]HAT2159634.1 response regulator transcription factor [Legionella pneumophila]HAT8773745.1 response regulator [Legionella pneumophila]HAU1061167.1 response regulator transcription factor [Legionella pneumophila]
MQSKNQTIFIIDDDASVCDGLRWLFESIHLNVETFTSASSFLENMQKKQGCLIVDVRLPGMSGLELLELLKLEKSSLPVIVMTGYGDISMAVRAMKAGAVDFLLKPFNNQCLLETVQKYLSQSDSTSSQVCAQERIELLSKREQEIIELIMEGNLNKEIAFSLSISISTVEAHRANIMKKMRAKNVAQLIKMYLLGQVNTPSL